MNVPHRTINHNHLKTLNVTIAISGTLLILAFLAISLVGSYRATTQKEEENLRVLTMTAASKSQSLFSSLLITARFLDARIQDKPDTDPRFDPVFNHLVELFRDSTGRRVDLRMVTKDGGLFYLPSKSPKPLADVSDREYFTVQRDAPTGGLHFGEPVKSHVTGQWGIPVSYRLHDNKFGILVLIAVIEFRDIDSTFAEIITNSDHAVTLIREDRLVLSRSPFNEFIIGKRFPYWPDRARKGTVEIFTPERQVRSVYYRKLDGLPLYIMVSADTNRIQTKWLKKAVLQTGVTAVILIAFLLLTLRQMQLLRKNIGIQDQLENAARFDGLTGLRNRRYFFERFAEELERSKRTQSPLVFLSIDIDFFKILNDTMGHPEGDRVLKLMSGLIDQNIRAFDISGRIGGEEFAVILTEATLNEGMEIAERIRKSAESITVGDWSGGISIGVAEWNGKAEKMEELYKRADDALYAAKNAGRKQSRRRGVLILIRAHKLCGDLYAFGPIAVGRIHDVEA